jgi:hypothetical protein
LLRLSQYHAEIADQNKALEEGVFSLGLLYLIALILN